MGFMHQLGNLWEGGRWPSWSLSVLLCKLWSYCCQYMYCYALNNKIKVEILKKKTQQMYKHKTR